MFMIEIIEAGTSLSTADPTGRVSDGFIKLRGLLFERNTIPEEARDYFDDDSFDRSSEDLWYLPIRHHEDTSLNVGGLILKTEGRENHFLRVGSFATPSIPNIQAMGIEFPVKNKLGRVSKDHESRFRTLVIV
jgi:hypothetical protein